MLMIERTCDAIACWVISRAHGKVAHGREFEAKENASTVEKINKAKDFSGYQADFEKHGLSYAVQSVFLQMCEMKMFGDTSDSRAFQNATCHAIARMAACVEAKSSK